MNHNAAVSRKDPEAVSLLGLVLMILVSNAAFVYGFLNYGAS